MESNGDHPKDEPDTPIETIVIDPDSTIVELVACRLRTIEGLDGLTKIETLNMRQNLIEKIENISQLTTLKHIELYDNHIERIEGLDSLVQLKHIDLSFSKSKQII
jgi:Leucine-rich repeat (LRR) protein